MLTWLRNRPASVRRAARPAVTNQKSPVEAPRSVVSDQKTDDFVQQASVENQDRVGDELPPPFFADADPAFLDLNDLVENENQPPPLPVVSVQKDDSPTQTDLAAALRELPPWPHRDDPARTEQLLGILRQLDRIAGDVCAALETERDQSSALSLPRKPR